MFREATEAALVISVMLAFAKRMDVDPQKGRMTLVRQVILGTISAFIICLILGGAKSLEHKIEVRMDKKPTSKGWFMKYSFAYLSFFTVFREGVEAILLIGGVAISAPAKSFPLSIITGIIAGLAVGLCVYYFGNKMGISIFLVGSTIFLTLMSAGLFTNSIGYFQNYVYGRKYKLDADAGYVFDIPKSHDYKNGQMLNCCNPNLPENGGWQLFQKLLGWTHAATIGSVVGYICYWLAIAAFYIYKGKTTKAHRV
ncbi:Plasma membrane iron permease [Zancudomyces culisetae]|uniref:Plasma membrane iron permease n=1 Tax=Zancudomyces culisetae TaxID=1213189 RepID=A0A1R1PMI5_ZANCU|nr:Plasma membrane iron permease [Zancudomyces culisetae]|eukprot:OMH82175.1 Plasma membrane iron permease [Zancudomyces culisetae]